MSHVHIYGREGNSIGTLWVDETGHVKDDGSGPARVAADGLGHEVGRECGEELLDSIVKKLDSTPYVSARKCNKPDCQSLHSEQR